MIECMWGLLDNNLLGHYLNRRQNVALYNMRLNEALNHQEIRLGYLQHIVHSSQMRGVSKCDGSPQSAINED